MKNLYESQYSQITYVNTNSLIFQKWLNKSEILTDKKFQYEMLHLLFQIEKNTPRYLKIDLRNFLYIVSYDMQIWINYYINSNIVKNNVEKIAFLNCKDEVAKISVDLTLNCIENSKMNYKFFDDEKLLSDWLFC